MLTPLYLKKRISGLEKEKERLEKEITELKGEEEKELEKELLVLKEKIKIFQKLFQRHKNSSKIFSLLESLCHPKVQFLKLNLDTKNSQEKYFSNLKQISENLKDYQTSLLKIETALPQDLSLSDLLNFLQKISAENGLLLKNVVQAKESKMEAKGILAKVKETYFNLNLIGSYASLKGFLQALEKSSRLIEVESVFVDETDEGLPKYNISIKVHSL